MKKNMYYLMVTVVVLTSACKNENDDPGKIIPVTGITLDQTELIVTQGLKKVLKANIVPDDATNKAVKWNSNNPAIEIDEFTGEMHVLAVTEDVISITVKTVDGGFSASINVHSVDIPAIGVSLKEKDVVVESGRAMILEALVIPNAAANKRVIWESDNLEVATIHKTSGEITGHSTGVAKITVTTEDGGFQASCNVRVPFLTNLLQNPSFEEGADNVIPLFWTKLTQNWFDSYYENPGSITVNETQTNRIGPASDSFFSGNGSFFLSHLTGNYAARIQGNQTGGMYQIIEVKPGVDYWISSDIGFRNNNVNTSIKTNETLKILSKDGVTTYFEVPIIYGGVTTGNGTTAVLSGVSSFFTMPESVTEVRFQFDQRSFSNPDQAPLMLIDNCKFCELPEKP